MKKLFLILPLIVLVFNIAQSQERKSVDHHSDRLEMLKSKLDLTDDQVNEIKALQGNSQEKGRRHRGQMRSEFAEILTDDQKEKLKSLRPEKGRKRRGYSKRKRGGKLAQPLSKRSPEIYEHIKSMRIEFDDKISEEDKAQIVSIRSRKKEVIAKMKSERNESSEKSKTRNRKAHRPFNSALKSLREEAQKLTEIYKEDVVTLFADNKETLDELRPTKSEGTAKNKRQRNHRRFKVGRFLFMDINNGQEKKNELSANSTLLKSVSPNPTQGDANIFFEVYQKESIKIELLNLNGQHLKTIANESYAPGQHYKNIDISSYPDGTYIVSINNGHSIQTEKLVLQR